MKKAFLVFLSAVLISISQYTQNNFVFAYGPEIVGDGIDNDGDGYVDEIDNYVITNPNVGVPMPDNSNVGVPLFNVGVPMPGNSNVGVQVPYSNYGNIGVQMPNNSNVGIPLTGQTPVNKPVLRSPNQPNKNPPKQNASGQSSNSINLLGNAAQGFKDGSTGYCARHGQPLFNNAKKCFLCK